MIEQIAGSVIETVGAITAIIGTLMLAVKSRHAGWGFVLYLASNVAWIGFAIMHSHWGLLIQNVAFTATSIIGVWTWLIQPRLSQERRRR